MSKPRQSLLRCSFCDQWFNYREVREDHEQHCLNKKTTNLLKQAQQDILESQKMAQEIHQTLQIQGAILENAQSTMKAVKTELKKSKKTLDRFF